MPETVVSENKTFQDLNPLFVGYEYCEPGHCFGPAVREYYLLHYIMAGKGSYFVEGREYRLQKGDCFLIKPGQLTVYRADRDEPWYYVWIGFNGRLAEDFRNLKPVSRVGAGVFLEIRRLEDFSGLRKEYLTSLLFRLYCDFFQNRKQEKDVAGELYEYICYNYMSDITVEGMAAMVNVDRRYLSRLFKKKYGLPLKQFLVEYRMQRAAQFLREGMSVSCVADMVGYHDVCNFSKMFKKVWGQSPALFAGKDICLF